MKQTEALDILKTGVNVFLTGQPGSGKTHTVNQYADYLKKHNIQVSITASTGIAATHLNGLTIHSWSGIGIKDYLSKSDLEKITGRRYITKRVEEAKVLIIDEISMLEAKTFALVDLVCQKIRGSQKPFGGLQVVVVGDFFQLPPISKQEQALFAFQSPAWQKANFRVCYLTEQYRQDDQIFLEMLSAIRSNTFDESHFKIIEKRIVSNNQSPKEITRIFSHNMDVDRLNNQELAKLPSKAEVFLMTSRGQRNFVDNLKKGCLSPENLLLKKGAWVMFTKNNLKEGFVNGTLGEVIGFSKENNWPIIETSHGRRLEVGPMEWTVEENGRMKARIFQIPLRLAWAITIHKSQGMSLEAAVMDLQKTFEFGQGYVALSRVRRLSGLYLLGYNQQAFLTHPEMQKQDQIFQGQSEEATANFAGLSQEQIIAQQNIFLKASGGSLAEKIPGKKERINKKEKESTYQKTWSLIKQGKSLAEMIGERGLTEGTIIGHLENLVLREKISKQEVESLIGDDWLWEMPEICMAFKELDTDNLQPVFEMFNGRYSYNQLRLARLMLSFN